MGIKLTNNAKSTLATAITSGSTTITLSSGGGALFPSLGASDYFYGTLINNANEREIVKVTARSGDTLTVVRGQDGTTARPYSAGDRFELLATNAMLMALDQEALAAVTASGTNTYTATLSPAPNGYNTDQIYPVIIANTNTSSTPTLNLNGYGAKTIKRMDGSALMPGDLRGLHLFHYDGTDFLVLNPRSQTDIKGAAVASAATTDIWSGEGSTKHITGTTTITSFGTAPRAGAWMKVIFDDALTLTHSTNLNLPGAANITTAPDDFAFVFADTTTQHDVLYFRKSGSPISLTNPDNTTQTLTFGTTTNWNADLGHIAVLTLTGNTTLAAPTNLKRGTYILHVIQDSTGGRTITWNSAYLGAGGGPVPQPNPSANTRTIYKFISDGTNLYYLAPTRLTYSTSQTLSGNAVDFTGIPNDVRRITVIVDSVSGNGSAYLGVQIGTSSGIESSSYTSTSAVVAGGISNSSSSSMFLMEAGTPVASTVRRGILTLCLLVPNLWVAFGIMTREVDATGNYLFAGSKSLGGAIDRVRLTWNNGTDTFDSGTAVIFWEF